MKNSRLLAVLAAAALALAALVPAAPAAAATGTVTIPITLETSPTQPVSFVMTYYDRNLVPVQGIQSLQQPAGTTSFEFSTTPDAGTYYVSVHAYSFSSGIQQNWARVYAGGTRFPALAAPVTVVGGQTTLVGALTLPEATKVQGTTTTADSTGVLSDAATVELWQQNPDDSQFYRVDSYNAESDGFFQWAFVQPGTYFLRSESVDARPTPAETPTFTASLGSTSTVNPAITTLREYSTDRLEGDDRFETAVAITTELFPGSGPIGIPVLYIANGLNYPDALSAGPAAAKLEGALLTVTPTSIPAVVLAEIERLAPERIVIVGGPTNVSAAVATQLDGLAEDVDRIAGTDRFDTSRRLIRDAFGCPGPDCASEAVFIATGLNYPDALAASAAAGGIGAPVLLVNGSAATVDAASAALIDELDPLRIYILGGLPSVSAGIATDLADDAPWIDRLAGADRFATSALIARTVIGRSDTVFGSTGLNFADALTGGPLAASLGAPMLLSPKSCAPVSINDAIIGVDATHIVYLGSGASIENVLRPDAAVIC